MAYLPSLKTESSHPTLTEGQIRLREACAQRLADGMDVATLAKRLSKGSKRRETQWRHKLRRWAATDETFIQYLFDYTNGILRSSLPAAGAGLSRRAARGRVGETKLLMEAARFHSPKTQHEHSGEIKITMDMPRPPRRVEQIEEPVIDAEVVE